MEDSKAEYPTWIFAIINNDKESGMKNWAFRRPYCSPVAGFVQADSGE